MPWQDLAQGLFFTLQLNLKCIIYICCHALFDMSEVLQDKTKGLLFEDRRRNKPKTTLLLWCFFSCVVSSCTLRVGKLWTATYIELYILALIWTASQHRDAQLDWSDLQHDKVNERPAIIQRNLAKSNGPVCIWTDKQDSCYDHLKRFKRVC